MLDYALDIEPELIVDKPLFKPALNAPLLEKGYQDIIADKFRGIKTKPVPNVDMQLAEELTQFFYQKVGIKPDLVVKGFQEEAVGLAIGRIKENQSFFLGDGPGMGKTLQGAAIAKWFSDSYPDKEVVIIHDLGGKGEWAEYPLEGKIDFITMDEAKIRYTGPSTKKSRTKPGLLIIDEAHRCKNAVSGNHKLLKLDCPKVILTGTSVDKIEEFNNYAAAFPTMVEKNPYKELAKNGQLVMRSGIYKNFEVITESIPLDISDKELTSRFQVHNVNKQEFTGSFVFEHLKLERFQKCLERSFEDGRVPIILTQQVDVSGPTGTPSEVLERLSKHLNGKVIYLRKKITKNDLHDRISTSVDKGEFPIIAGSMDTLGRGANLQDIGGLPRDLYILGITHEVTSTLQALYRVLRPDAASAPRIFITPVEHPFDYNIMVNTIDKIQNYPSFDTTMKQVLNKLVESYGIDPNIGRNLMSFRKYKDMLAADNELMLLVASDAGFRPKLVPTSSGGYVRINLSEVVPLWPKIASKVTDLLERKRQAKLHETHIDLSGRLSLLPPSSDLNKRAEFYRTLIYTMIDELDSLAQAATRKK